MGDDDVVAAPPVRPVVAEVPGQRLVADDMAVVQVDQGWNTGRTARTSRTRLKSSTVVGEGWETPGALMLV